MATDVAAEILEHLESDNRGDLVEQSLAAHLLRHGALVSHVVIHGECFALGGIVVKQKFFKFQMVKLM